MFVSVHVQEHTHVSQVEVRGKLSGVDSFWGSISSSQGGSQVLLPTEPSHSPMVNFQHGNVKQHHRTCMLYNHYNEVMWCKHMFLQKNDHLSRLFEQLQKEIFLALYWKKHHQRGEKQGNNCFKFQTTKHISLIIKMRICLAAKHFCK